MQHEPVVNRPVRWEDFFQPVEKPPRPHAVPGFLPVDEEPRVAPAEEGGVPRAAGLTVFFAAVLAVLLLVVFFLGSTLGRLGAVVVLGLAAPVVLPGLRRRARQRTP